MSSAQLTTDDILPIVSSSGRAKILSSFNKTPFDFRFKIHPLANNKAMMGLDHEFFKAAELEQQQEAPNSIQLIYCNNITGISNYMPFTAWMLAHRIGHLNLIYRPNQAIGRRLENGHVFQVVRECMIEYCQLASDGQPRQYRYEIETGKARQAEFESPPEECDMYPDAWRPTLMVLQNTRCARKIALNNTADCFSELIAQYIITGKISLLPVSEWAQRFAALKDSKNHLGSGEYYSLIRKADVFAYFREQHGDAHMQKMIDAMEVGLARECHVWLAKLVGQTWSF